MADDFMGGMKDALSIFATSAMMSNFQSLAEDRIRNREIQDFNQRRLEAEDVRQERQADATFGALLADPSKGVPLDMAISEGNRLSMKYGSGDPNMMVGKRDYENYVAELEGTLARTDLPTSDARRLALAPLEAKALEHPVYLRGYMTKKDHLNDWKEKPAAYAAFGASGFTPATTDHLLKNLRAGESLALLKDGDWRKAALYNQAAETMRKVANGEDVPEGDLAQHLTAAHGAGFKIGETGAEIVKGTTGEAQYNLAQKDAESFDKTVVNPFGKLWGMVNEERAIKSMAFTSAIEDPTTSLARQLKPQEQKAFQETVAKMELVNEQATKRFQDFQNRYKIAKANPMTHPADLILLDQQLLVERQKAAALTEPFKRYKMFQEVPTSENFKAVATASENLNTTMRRWEADKQRLLTVSEQATQQQIATGKTKLAVDQATNEFGERFLGLAGDNPELYDADGTLNISKAGKLAAPIVAELNKKYNVKLEAAEIVSKYATAGKRSVPRTDTLEKLSPEQAAKFETFLSGLRLTKDVQSQLIKGGKIDRKLLGQTIAGGLPFTQGRILEAYILDAMEAEYRARTGAAMPEEEVKRAKRIFVPSNIDSDQTIKDKLTNLETHFQNKIDLTDPQGKLQSRIKPLRGEKKAEKKEPAQALKEFTPEAYNALKQKHPDWTPEQIGAAMARGEE